MFNSTWNSEEFSLSQFLKLMLFYITFVIFNKVSFHILNFFELLVISFFLGIFLNILLFIAIPFFRQKNTKKNWSNTDKPTNLQTLLKISARIYFCMFAFVLMNKNIVSDRSEHLNAQVIKKYKLSGNNKGGSPIWQITVKSDGYDAKKMGVASGQWARLSAGDEVIIEVNKGLLGYYVAKNINLKI